MSDEIESQIRIHTKRAATTRGNTGEISVETINGHTITFEQIDEAVLKHKYLEDKLQETEGEAE